MSTPRLAQPKRQPVTPTSDPKVEGLTFADVAAIEWNCGHDEVRSMPVDVLIAVLSFAEDRWYAKPTGWDHLTDLDELGTRLHSLREALDHIVGEGGTLETSGVEQISDKLKDITAQVDAQVCPWRQAEFHRNYRIALRDKVVAS
jgi:hypothetical protein